MQNLSKELKSLQNKMIDKRNQLLKMQKDLAQNASAIKGIQEELFALEKESKMLKAKQKRNAYCPKKPILGDERYKKFPDKNALDILRVLYYDFFHQDPSLSLTKDHIMFGDPSLSIWTQNYLIKGEIPFTLMLTANYQNYNPIEDYSVGIKLAKKNLSKEMGPEYLKLIAQLIKRYTNNEMNFICCDGGNEFCTLSFIGDIDFGYHPSNQKMYYDFFARLCDNNLRNIVYIGEKMKENATEEEIQKADSEIVLPNRQIIAKNLGISLEELTKSNEELRDQALILSRK